MASVSITSADMEKESIDPTPQELIDLRKKQKPELEVALYHTMVNLRTLQAEVAKLRAENDDLKAKIAESKKSKKD